jgi:hypothetical protein
MYNTVVNHMLRTLVLPIFSLSCLGILSSCSDCICTGKGVGTIAHVKLKHKDQPWYRCVHRDGQTMYQTMTTVSWTFQHELGYWDAYGAKSKQLYMRAQGKTFTVFPGYVWMGSTQGPTTEKLLTPSLFHDAMLHAMQNGAPLTQAQADGAFYQLMKAENFVLAGTYFATARNFGSSYNGPQNQQALTIKRRSFKSK